MELRSAQIVYSLSTGFSDRGLHVRGVGALSIRGADSWVCACRIRPMCPSLPCSLNLDFGSLFASPPSKEDLQYCNFLGVRRTRRRKTSSVHRSLFCNVGQFCYVDFWRSSMSSAGTAV